MLTMNQTIKKFMFSLFILFIGLSCNHSNMKTYQVKKVSRAIQLSGNGADPLWETALLLTDFSYPWRNDAPPQTAFRALWDDTHFYFLYRATDPEIISKERGLGERDVVNSDRVEIFFKADDKMDPYYALEMDALGRVLDTEGKSPGKVDFDWNWPAGQLTLKSAIDEEGYFVEGSISFQSLRDLGMYKDDQQLKAGLFRGEYLSDEQGEITVRWISWIIPNAEKPNFHIPSSFGILTLAD